MSFLDYLTTAGFATLASSAAILGAGRFLLRKLVEKTIDARFDERLEAVKAANAERLATVSAGLKARADGELEFIKSEFAKQLAELGAQWKRQADERLEQERARYAADLEILKAGLQKRASEDLERSKAMLTAAAQDSLEVAKLRRELYRPLNEVIYRFRNTARDSLRAPGDDRSESANELKVLAERIADLLYELRYDLERDGVFPTLHSYKAASNAFLERFRQHAASTAPDATTAGELVEVYRRLDQQYSDAVAVLRSLVSSTAAARAAGSAGSADPPAV